MKKRLSFVLALFYLLSITSIVLASPANPFADVPTNHWAYSAVSKLSKDGIITGYDDNYFRGDKTLTRYEMAQIIANAITKEDKANAEDKAIIEKLATEFSAELDKLGARVSNVENRVDKLESTISGLKFSGWDRLRYISTDKGTTNPVFSNRFDLSADTDPNNVLVFHFRDVVSNYTPMGAYPTGASGVSATNNKGANSGNTSNKTNQIADVNLTYKSLLPGLDVMAGRYSLNLSQTGYLAGSTGGFDGIEGLWKFGKSSLQFGYADATVVNLTNFNYSASTFANVANIYYGQYNYQPNQNLKFDVNYVKSQTGTSTQPVGKLTDGTTWAPGQDLLTLVGVGVNWKFNPDWAFVGDYWQNSATQAKIDNGGSSPAGYVARVAYKGNKLSVPGSWGAFVEYQRFQPDTWDANWTVSFLSPISTANDPYHGAFKGWDFQYNATLAKNFTFTAIYAFNLKNSVTNSDYFVNGGNNWTRMQLTYFF